MSSTQDAVRGGHTKVQEVLKKSGATYGYADASEEQVRNMSKRDPLSVGK